MTSLTAERMRGTEFKVRSTITERMNSGVSLGVVTWPRGGMEGWLQDSHYVFMYSDRICYLEDKLYFIINDHSEPRTYVLTYLLVYVLN